MTTHQGTKLNLYRFLHCTPDFFNQFIDFFLFIVAYITYNYFLLVLACFLRSV